MRRLLRRLISRLYAERARLARRRLGRRGEAWQYVLLDVASASHRPAGRSTVAPFFAKSADLRACPGQYWMAPDGVEALLARGDHCLAIRVDEEIAYRAFVMRDPAGVAEVAAPRGAPLPAWVVSGVYAHPAHRGCGLHASAMAWLAGEARRDGVRSIVAWIAEWNRSSRRAFARAGFRRLDDHPVSRT